MSAATKASARRIVAALCPGGALLVADEAMAAARLATGTRRRFGTCAAAVLVGLLTLARSHGTRAKGKHHRRGHKRHKHESKPTSSTTPSTTPSACKSDAQDCRDDWADYCEWMYVSPDQEACLAAFNKCCDLYAKCQTDDAIDCEDAVAF